MDPLSLLLLSVLCIIPTEGRQEVHITLDHDETFAVEDEDHGIAKRSVGWSEGLEDPNQNWEVKYKSKKNTPQKDESDNDYEVVVSKSLDETKSAEAKMKKMLIVPACVLGVLFVLCFWYQLCIRKKFICCDLKKRGRKMADAYVPGMEIKEDGEVSFYEITDKEQEALVDIAMVF